MLHLTVRRLCRVYNYPRWLGASQSKNLLKKYSVKAEQLSEEEKSPERRSYPKVEKLLKSESKNIPDEGLTVFIKHADLVFNYNKELRDKKPNTEQKERIDKPQIHKTISSAVSVEDYLFISPAPTQPFPGLTKLPAIYAALSKSRLTMLVVLTAMGGYAMAPGVFDVTTLACLTLGTTLQSAAANSTNQTMEVKYDTQMYRTRNRPLVKGLISREHAAAFALTSGVLGTGLLYYGANPLACSIGVANYFLYTALYTPMKRMNILNTWVGSVVGALPPIMGWAAATGSIDIGGLWLGTLLYIWQFPHFKALSWNIKADYQRAGYQMSSVTNPALCKRVAFRHTILMTLACCLGPSVGCTTEMFILYSLPCNLWGVYLGWKFYQGGDSKSSRALFRYSLVQMPYLILMMIISKKWYKEKNKSAPAETSMLST